MINRFTSAADVVTAAMPGTTSPVSMADLEAADKWLAGKTFTDSEIDDLCCGGTGHDGLPIAYPDVDLLTNRVLNDLFENLTDCDE